MNALRRKMFYGYWFIVPSLIIFLFSLPFLQAWIMKSSYYGRWLDVPAPAWSQISSVQNRTSQDERLSNLSGQFVWVYFGYLHCDGFCQQQWVTLFHLMQTIGHDDHVAVLLVSIDPERDEPISLATLASDLGAHFIPLTPDSLSQAQWLANQFHAPFQKKGNPTESYLLQHSGDIFLIAPDQNIKLVYSGNNWHYDQLVDDYVKLKKEMNFN